LFDLEPERAETRGFEGQGDDGQLYLFFDVNGID
jgi:hypothetical protein